MPTPDEIRQLQLEEAAKRQQRLSGAAVVPARPMEVEERQGGGRLEAESRFSPAENARRERQRLMEQYRVGQVTRDQYGSITDIDRSGGITNKAGEELPEVVRMRKFYKAAYAPGKPNADVWTSRIMSEEGLPRAAAEKRYEMVRDSIAMGLDQPVHATSGAGVRGSHYITPYDWRSRKRPVLGDYGPGIHLSSEDYGAPRPWSGGALASSMRNTPPDTRGDVIRHEGAHAISAWAPRYKEFGPGQTPESIGWEAGITPEAAVDDWNLSRIMKAFPGAYGPGSKTSIAHGEHHEHSKSPHELYANIIYTRAHLGRLFTAQDIAGMRNSGLYDEGTGTERTGWNKSPFQASGDLIRALQRGLSPLSDEEIANILNQVSDAGTRQPPSQMRA